MRRFVKGSFAAAAAMLLSVSPAWAAVGPQGKCEAGKNQESGKYAFCLHKAEAKLLKTKGACSVATETDCYRDQDCPIGESCGKDTTSYNEAVSKCEAKYVAKWNTLETKATEALTTCPDEPLLQAAVKQAIDECVSNVASGLAGEGLEDWFGDMTTCTTDLGTCNGSLGTCSTNLSSCSSNLSTCNGNLATCTTDLGTAQSDLTTCNDDLSTCQTDLSQSQSNLSTCTSDLGDFASDLADCTSDLGDCTSDLGTCSSDLATCNAVLGICPTDLAACLAAPQGQRVRTGQTLCYNAAGTIIACAGTGQDGELLKGLTVSFTDNGDGTVTDNRTGLMWEKISDDGSIHDKDTQYTWINAFTKIATLNGGGGFAGYTDWRLPNVSELQSLANYGAVNPAVHAPFDTGCVPACTVLTCSCTQSSSYWSSTTYQSAPTNAWRALFTVGSVSNGTRTSSFYVRGVRGGP